MAVVAAVLLAQVAAQAGLEDFLPLAVEVEVHVDLRQDHLAQAEQVLLGWLSLQLTSKHEIRSHQFRHKHCRECHHLGWGISLDSSCWLLH